MKSIILSVALFAGLTFVSCKKCQTCTTTTTQVVNGYEMSTNTSSEFCGKEYDNAPAEGTVVQNASGVEQTVTIVCSDN
jgi:hypothetical protein